MKSIIRFILILLIITITPSFVLAGGVKLKYKLVPGQKWECTRKSHMTFEVMGKKQVQLGPVAAVMVDLLVVQGDRLDDLVRLIKAQGLFSEAGIAPE